MLMDRKLVCSDLSNIRMQLLLNSELKCMFKGIRGMLL